MRAYFALPEAMKHRVSGIRLGASAAFVGGLIAAGLPSAGLAQVPTGPCLNPAAPLTVEEARLTRVLTGHTESAPQEMIEGMGFQNFAPSFVTALCAVSDLPTAQALMISQGELLWQTAVAVAQGREPGGTLPRSDDRPLYWTRLQLEAAMAQWQPSFTLAPSDLNNLIISLDQASRGMLSIAYPPNPAIKKIIMSGFDVFTLDGGAGGGNNIRTGNPSGATALSLDGTVWLGADHIPIVIHTYLLPVNYGPFQLGYQENTIGPFYEPGPQQIWASITMSQGGTSVEFDLEQWNGRYHGQSVGNDNIAVCPTVPNPTPPPTNIPQLPSTGVTHAPGGFQTPQVTQCDITPPTNWVPSPTTWTQNDPEQWTTTSLPIGTLIGANTGNGIAKPPTDAWAGAGAFNVVWHTPLTEFPNCNLSMTVSYNSPVVTTYPPPTPPTPPDPNSCAEMGGGGNYLSNESAYRNTLLRDTFGLNIFAGHIHTPIMSHFLSTNTTDITDSQYEAWRTSIVAQARSLIFTIGNNLPSTHP